MLLNSRILLTPKLLQASKMKYRRKSVTLSIRLAATVVCTLAEQVVVRLSVNLHSLHNRKAEEASSMQQPLPPFQLPSSSLDTHSPQHVSHHLPIPWIIRPVHGSLNSQSGNTLGGCVRESCRFGWPCSDPVGPYLKPSHT
jgi:hypothetical protein